LEWTGQLSLQKSQSRWMRDRYRRQTRCLKGSHRRYSCSWWREAGSLAWRTIVQNHQGQLGMISVLVGRAPQLSQCRRMCLLGRRGYSGAPRQSTPSFRLYAALLVFLSLVSIWIRLPLRPAKADYWCPATGWSCCRRIWCLRSSVLFAWGDWRSVWSLVHSLTWSEWQSSLQCPPFREPQTSLFVGHCQTPFEDQQFRTNLNVACSLSVVGCDSRWRTGCCWGYLTALQRGTQSSCWWPRFHSLGHRALQWSEERLAYLCLFCRQVIHW